MTKKRIHKLRFSFFPLWIIAVTILIVASIFLQKFAAASYFKTNTEDHTYYLPSSSWMKVFSCGYNEATADLIWTKFIIYFSDAPKIEVKPGDILTKERAREIEKQDKNVNYSLNYVDVITEIDSHFRGAYKHGARLIMYHRGTITRSTIEMAAEILEKATSIFPDDGELYFNLGFLHYYEIVPFAKDAAEKDQFKRKGALLLQKASTMDNAPPYAKRLATNLLTRHGMDELVIEHLLHMLETETDENIRKSVQERLVDAIQKKNMTDLEMRNKVFDEWKTTAAYIPFSLYTLLLPISWDSSLFDDEYSPTESIVED